MTLDPTPAQIAQDLRDAAQAVHSYGHARHNYVAPDGTVCAVGAIGLATGWFGRVVHPDSGIWDFTSPPTGLDTRERFNASVAALAPLLPQDCGGACTDSPGGFDAGYHGHMRPTDRAFHFNDYICEGGAELALLLTQAAEKIEADQ